VVSAKRERDYRDDARCYHLHQSLKAEPRASEPSDRSITTVERVTREALSAG
jgi:hypothetical protein